MAATKVPTEKGYSVVARREFENFLQTTAFKSLQFIKHSSYWIESMFWIVFLIGGTALAIRDVRNVVEEYTSEDTYVRLRVIGLQNLTFDDAIICADYDVRALNLSDPQLAQHANTTEINQLSQLLNVSSVKFLYMSLKLFTAISLLEQGRSADYERKLADLHSDDDVVGLEQLQEWMKWQKVDIFHLGSLVGNWLCQSMQIRINTIRRGNPSSTVNPCDPSNITWLGVIPFVNVAVSETTLCLNIGGQIMFGSMLDRIVIVLNTNNLFQHSPNANRSSDDDISSYVDFSGDAVSTDMTKYWVMFPSTGCTAFEIGIDAELHLIDRQAARCNSTARTRMACYGGCDVLRYENTKQCNCTQMGWRYLYTGYRKMCFDVQTLGQHLECRRAARESKLSERCLQACLFPCSHRQRDITALAANRKCAEENVGGAVSLELTPKRFTVPVFEEQFSVGISELFSRLGGTCGLWLGVGMLGICHALLLPLKLLARLVQYSDGIKRAGSPVVMELRAAPM